MACCIILLNNLRSRGAAFKMWLQKQIKRPRSSQLTRQVLLSVKNRNTHFTSAGLQTLPVKSCFMTLKWLNVKGLPLSLHIIPACIICLCIIPDFSAHLCLPLHLTNYLTTRFSSSSSTSCYIPAKHNTTFRPNGVKHARLVWECPRQWTALRTKKREAKGLKMGGKTETQRLEWQSELVLWYVGYRVTAGQRAEQWSLPLQTAPTRLSFHLPLCLSPRLRH